MHRALVWLTSLAVAASAVNAQTSMATSSITPTIDRALAATSLGDDLADVAIAPAGDRVAWVEKHGSLEAIEILSLPAGTPERLTTAKGKVSESEPHFSPEGERVAFLSQTGNEGKPEIWIAELAPIRGKRPAPKRLATFGGQLHNLRWLPDGTGLAALAIEGRAAKAGPLAAVPRDAGVVGAQVDVQRIAVWDAKTGARRWESPADLFVYEFDVAPNGRRFYGTVARGEGDAEWWFARRSTFENGVARIENRAPRFQITMPSLSPDGRHLAWIEGLMSDHGVNGGDVLVENLDRGEITNLTAGRAASPAWIAWTAPDRLVWVENVRGELAVVEISLSDRRPRELWRGAETLTAKGGAVGLALSRDGAEVAAIRHSFTRPPEVWTGPLADLRRESWKTLTNRHADIRPLWGEAKSISWPSDFAAGVEAQGWLLAPPATSEASGGASGSAPLVVLVHGGPSSAHRAGWPTLAGALASQGFYVLLPNPRGSFGWGTAFQEGNVKDFGYGDFRDLLAGVDASIASAPLDARRVGIYGWSYGGYMTMWAVTQTDRFRAAVAGAGIANWQSYYGQNRIDTWMLPFFGASVYADPRIYERSSPITYIQQAKTPTLVLHGERDAEVPAPQGYEFWKALKAHEVPTELVIYPDQGHRLNSEGDKDRIERTVAWFDRWLSGKAPTLLVVNKSEASVDLWDIASYHRRLRLATGASPHEVAVSPDGQTAVVSDYGPRGGPGVTLTVIDLAESRVVRTMDLGRHRRPHGVVFLDATRLAVTTEDTAHLLVVDPREGKILQEIPTEQKVSHMVAATADGRRAFVANIGSGSMTAIDLEAGKKLRDVVTGAGAEGIAVRPHASEVWVTNREADTLSIVDTETLEILSTVPCAGFPIRIAFTPDGTRALVSSARSGEVSLFDTATRKEIGRNKLDLAAVTDAARRLFGDRFATSPAPVGLVVAPDGKTAWVAATQSDAVVEIDVETLAVKGVLKAGKEPDGMAIRR